MGIFFGTDGIRGRACEELTDALAYKCGNALGSEKNNATIIIGRDTRPSGSFLSQAFAVGAMSAGANIIDIGICTTPAVAYVTKIVKADFGVMISASHNPSEYNGIKIFNNGGFKLGDDKENALERKFVKQVTVPHYRLGVYKEDLSLINLYINHLKKVGLSLSGLKIVIDASNGGAYKIAPKIFKSLGANVIELSCNNDGKNINNNCGSLYPEKMCNIVKEQNADMGFAFDGDADRIISCDENGDILDGDIMTFIISKWLKENSKLNKNTVVGTRHTNMGLELELKKDGITLERTDIGDKYVLERMLAENLSLGGEKSGHIILSNYSTTGDGVLCGILLANICKTKNVNLSKLASARLYPQCNIDVVVKDKMRVINSDSLSRVINEQEAILDEHSRIMVRVSGTEPKVRIMVESLNFSQAETSAKKIEQVIKNIDGGEICVE